MSDGQRGTVEVPADQPVWSVEPGQPFLVTVDPGAAVAVGTLDCRGGAIRSVADAWQVDDPGRINPVTGPIGVAGVRAGQTVTVEIAAVTLASERGLMLVRRQTTTFDFVDAGVLTFADVDGDHARVAGQRVPLRPMVGWVGLQPAEGTLATSACGRTGGNMDTPLVAAGARVLLPAEVDGAGLYLGDVHASQGDGEVFLTGVEIAATVQARVGVLTGVVLDGPIVETREVLAVLGPDSTLEESASGACRRAVALLATLNEISMHDAGFLLSAAGNLRISRFLPHYGSVCRMEIPKAVVDPSAWDDTGWLRRDLGPLFGSAIP